MPSNLTTSAAGRKWQKRQLRKSYLSCLPTEETVESADPAIQRKMRLRRHESARAACHRLAAALFMLPNVTDEDTCLALADEVLSLIEEPIAETWGEVKGDAGIVAEDDTAEERKLVAAAMLELQRSDPSAEGIATLALSPEMAWKPVLESAKAIPVDLMQLASLMHAESSVNPPPEELSKGFMFDPLKHYVGIFPTGITVGTVDDEPSRVSIWMPRRPDIRNSPIFVPNVCLTVGPPNAKALAFQLLRHAERAEAEAIKFRQQCEADGCWDEFASMDSMSEPIIVGSNEGAEDE